MCVGLFSPVAQALRYDCSRFRSSQCRSSRRYTVLSWSLTFLVVAIIAGVLGFAGIAGVATSIAKVTFILFIALFLLSFLMGRRSVR
jgi:uncharacterized membrane protein YtjA (UPF0391 family)